jgi:hypothetical protein
MSLSLCILKDVDMGCVPVPAMVQLTTEEASPRSNVRAAAVLALTLPAQGLQLLTAPTAPPGWTAGRTPPVTWPTAVGGPGMTGSCATLR